LRLVPVSWLRGRRVTKCSTDRRKRVGSRRGSGIVLNCLTFRISWRRDRLQGWLARWFRGRHATSGRRPCLPRWPKNSHQTTADHDRDHSQLCGQPFHDDSSSYLDHPVEATTPRYVQRPQRELLRPASPTASTVIGSAPERSLRIVRSRVKRASRVAKYQNQENRKRSLPSRRSMTRTTGHGWQLAAMLSWQHECSRWSHTGKRRRVCSLANR